MSKREVKAIHPKARAERHRTNGGQVYWLIRLSPSAHVPYAEGDTERAAWRDAASKLGVKATSEDPRRVRAATLRQHVLSALIGAPAGLEAESVWGRVRDFFPGAPVKPPEVWRALGALRRAGMVRYRRPRWEVVDGR